MPDLNNRYLFTVYQYKTKTPAGQSPVTFNQSKGYYDDHGKLQLSRFFDYEKNQWAPTTYTYNNYGQLTSVKDAQNNITGCDLDSWDRLTRVTDPQGNYHDFQYDIAARTKTTTFVPYGGAAENHYIEGYDQWGRTVSRRGFPDGINGQAIEDKYEYDLVGNLTKQTDPNNKVTQFDYDSLNRLTKVTNALNEVTDYAYDRLGNLTQSKQYEGATTFTTTRQYSERGKLTSKQLPAGISNIVGSQQTVINDFPFKGKKNRLRISRQGK